jgi:hypothetical protein
MNSDAIGDPLREPISCVTTIIVMPSGASAA